MTIVIPPVELDDLIETEIRHQVEHVMRNDQRGGAAGQPPRMVHDGAQRRTMQVIEMRMRHQHQVDGRKVVNAQPGFAYPLQKKEPAREVRVDGDVLPAHLHKERGMADERDPEFTIVYQLWLVGAAGAGGDRGVTNQLSELRRPLAQGRISKSRL